MDPDDLDQDPGGEPAPGSAGVDPNTTDAGGDIDINTIVADVEAGLLDPNAGRDDQGGTDDGGDPKSATPPPAPLDPRVAATQAFVDKNYGGDWNAFLEAQYASRAENQRLKEDNERLRGGDQGRGGAAPRDIAAEIKSRADQDAEVASIREQTTALDSSIQQIDTRNQHITAEYGRAQTEMESLNQQLLAAPEDQRYNLQMKMIRLENKMIALTGEFNSNTSIRDARTQTKAILSRDLRRAMDDIRGRIAQEDEDARAEQADNARTFDHYNRAFDAELSRYDVDPKSEKARYLYQATKGILADYLQRRGYEAPPLDANGFRDAVSKLLDAAAKSTGGLKLKVGGNGSRGPARRGAPAPVPPRPGAPRLNGPGGTLARRPGTPPRSADELLDDPNMVRQRAQNIMEAHARARAQRGRGGLA